MPQAASIVMGPPGFASISNVQVIPTATNFVVKWLTDQAVQSDVVWTAITDAAPPGQGPYTGTVAEAGPFTQHSVTVTPSPAAGGHQYAFRITLDNADSSGLTQRDYVGTVQLLGARTPTTKLAPSVPVRFYQFGGTPPPGAGGGPTGSNWNTYTWAQYNPKGTTYPTP